MADVLIRDLAEETVAKIDLLAGRSGLSRVEYLRRTVEQEAARASGSSATRDRWARLAELAHDVRSEDFESRAWRHA